MSGAVVVTCAAILASGLGVPSCYPPPPPPAIELSGYVCMNGPAALALAIDLKRDMIPTEPCGADTILVGDGADAWKPGNTIRIEHGGRKYLLHYFAPKEDGFNIVLLEPLTEV